MKKKRGNKYRLKGKEGEHQLHLSCVNDVDSICSEEILAVLSLLSKRCGHHLS